MAKTVAVRLYYNNDANALIRLAEAIRKDEALSIDLRAKLMTKLQEVSKELLTIDMSRRKNSLRNVR